jgi:hypothetical protein
VGASLRKPPHYHRADTFQIRQDIIIPEPQDSKASTRQKTVAGGVARRFPMLAAVHFNDQTCFQAREIGNVRTNRHLAPETKSIKLSCLQ